MDSPCSEWPVCHGSIDHYNSVCQRTWVAGDCISCTVHNYWDLTNSVYYCLTRTVSNSDFDFKVFKKPNTHYFQLHCNLMDDMIFCVKYDEGDFSASIQTKQTEYGYWVEVPKKVIYDPRNRYLLEEKSLTVQFQVVCNTSFTRVPLADNGRRTRRDEELFSRDMLKLHGLRIITGDFVIKVRDKPFLVHKFIFKARTSWFKVNPYSSNWNLISIEGEPLVMDKVVQYLYSGVLEEMDLCGMMQVLEIAICLHMTGLIQTSNAILMRMMSKDNVQEILHTAQKLDVIDLTNYAEERLPESGTASSGKKSSKKHRKKHH